MRACCTHVVDWQRNGELFYMRACCTNFFDEQRNGERLAMRACYRYFRYRKEMLRDLARMFFMEKSGNIWLCMFYKFQGHEMSPTLIILLIHCQYARSIKITDFVSQITVRLYVVVSSHDKITLWQDTTL